MITLGFDPDLHTSGAAIVDGDKLLMVALTSVPSRVKGTRAALQNAIAAQELMWPMDRVERIAIESPQFYGGGKNKADPADLINLALVSGAAGDLFAKTYPAADIGYVVPRDWKGQVPKHIHHKRICAALGLDYSTDGKRVIPRWPDSTHVVGKITPARAQHVLDAVGLALWAQKPAIERHMVIRTRP